MAGLNLPVFPLPGVPRPYRGRGNRGKGSAVPVSGCFGNRGKEQTALLWSERGQSVSAAPDLFGHESEPIPHTNNRPEAAALVEESVAIFQTGNSKLEAAVARIAPKES